MVNTGGLVKYTRNHHDRDDATVTLIKSPVYHDKY